MEEPYPDAVPSGAKCNSECINEPAYNALEGNTYPNTFVVDENDTRDNSPSIKPCYTGQFFLQLVSQQTLRCKLQKKISRVTPHFSNLQSNKMLRCEFQ